jgi:hypothetical protein
LGRPRLTAEEKSAEGIVGEGQLKLKPKGGDHREAEPQRLELKARTVPREGIEREARVEEWR